MKKKKRRTFQSHPIEGKSREKNNNVDGCKRERKGKRRGGGGGVDLDGKTLGGGEDLRCPSGKGRHNH